LESFEDIRPYRNNEVSEVVGALLQNDDFYSALAGLHFPKLKKRFPGLALRVIKRPINKKLKYVDTVEKVQDLIASYMNRVFKKTTTSITESGLSDLSKDRSYLFISNHRDIVFDPALISYFLHGTDHQTVEIAVGDNLLKKEFVSDLMRLNKSFVVKRSEVGRDKIKASRQLSEYMHQAIADGNNVWIAQKEGRAKDGLDKTDPTILKMLHMSRRDGENKQSIMDCVNDLHIVPVSISYEFDPCDEMKADELAAKECGQIIEKTNESDVQSITKSIEGFKGAIHVSFGTEITATDSDVVAIADKIDQQIIANYKLYHSNYLAYDVLQKTDPTIGPALEALSSDVVISEEYRSEFLERYVSIPSKLKPFFLQMYANPVLSKLTL
jgi:1-acyl-sn-glycerol-3-phosphate acyltransferase